jgi:hypothetical protein
MSYEDDLIVGFPPYPDSLDDGTEYDDGVNEFYLGDPDEDYPRD